MAMHSGKAITVLAAALACSLGAGAQGPGTSATYYASAEGKTGAELKTALSGIIYSHTERSYADLWTDFRQTDMRPDGKVWDMYSGVTNFTIGTDQAGNFHQEGDVYNREHSFPKSWFGGNIMPMYTDLNHLYPTDGYVNNRRSNYPFGENNGEIYQSEGGFSKLGLCTVQGYDGKVFEPADEYKGDFARTYFYMVTCYEEKLPDWYAYTDAQPTLDGSTYPGLASWQLEMLMRWATADPVSEKETNRNEAVWAIQKNRNPFIDYPGLEQYIWGSRVGQPFHYITASTTIASAKQPNVKTSTFDLNGRKVKTRKSRRGTVLVKRGKKLLTR
jgi:endonuclease I